MYRFGKIKKVFSPTETRKKEQKPFFRFATKLKPVKMPKLIPLLIFFFSIATGHAQNSKLIASCHADGGRCTGSAYCSACSNCSGCKHCNSGGSCGVCASYSEPVKTVYKKPAKKKAASSGISATKPGYQKTATKKAATKKPAQGIYAPAPSYKAGDNLSVASEILNLREGPGTDYPVIETLEKGDSVQVLGYDAEWVQVIARKSKNVGYVKVAFLK